MFVLQMGVIYILPDLIGLTPTVLMKGVAILSCLAKQTHVCALSD